MSLVIIGAHNPINQKLLAFARQEKRPTVAVYHQMVPKEYQDGLTIAIDVTSAKDLAAVAKPGDTIVMDLSETSSPKANSMTERLHAVLAATLGRDIRLVLLDRFLPDMTKAAKDESQSLQFVWADEIDRFVKNSGASVSVLRSGPVYGAENGVFLDSAFWRQILKGGAVSTPVAPDQKLSLIASDDVARVLYDVATDSLAGKGNLEELHIPGDNDVSIADLVELGAKFAGTKAFARQEPDPLRRLLDFVLGRSKSAALPKASCGRANSALARAYSQKFGVRHRSHHDCVRKIVSDLAKAAG